jgi:transposase
VVTTRPSLPLPIPFKRFLFSSYRCAGSIIIPPCPEAICFRVFTKDLYAIADWLQSCGVTTVAMESTGVYWVALFEVLEERGFQVKLVDARKVKNVSGRKSDVLDCQWLQQLESYGLLAGAYRGSANRSRRRLQEAESASGAVST